MCDIALRPKREPRTARSQLNTRGAKNDTREHTCPSPLEVCIPRRIPLPSSLAEVAANDGKLPNLLLNTVPLGPSNHNLSPKARCVIHNSGRPVSALYFAKRIELSLPLLLRNAAFGHDVRPGTPPVGTLRWGRGRPLIVREWAPVPVYVAGGAHSGMRATGLRENQQRPR